MSCVQTTASSAELRRPESTVNDSSASTTRSSARNGDARCRDASTSPYKPFTSHAPKSWRVQRDAPDPPAFSQAIGFPTRFLSRSGDVSNSKPAPALGLL